MAVAEENNKSNNTEQNNMNLSTPFFTYVRSVDLKDLNPITRSLLQQKDGGTKSIENPG